MQLWTLPPSKLAHTKTYVTTNFRGGLAENCSTAMGNFAMAEHIAQHIHNDD